MTREKLAKKISLGHKTAESAIEKLFADKQLSRDFILQTGGRGPITFYSNGKLKMNFDAKSFSLHRNARNQICSRFGIPQKYIQTLTELGDEGRMLASFIFNKHNEFAPGKRQLVRAVSDEVRGVLSDHYRRLDAYSIIKSFVDSGVSCGGYPVDGLYTDTRLFVELLHPDPVIINTPKNGDVVMAFGSRLSTSDYGDGALDLRFFMMQGVCLNGMVMESVMRQVHLGKKLPANLALSERTYRLDSETTASAISDLTRDLFSTERIKKHIEAIQAASSESVDAKAELIKRYKAGELYKGEVEEIENALLNENPADGIFGESTIWKISQGISAFARDADPERSRELQDIAGNMVAKTLKV